jgi:hypothetical protein
MTGSGVHNKNRWLITFKSVRFLPPHPLFLPPHPFSPFTPRITLSDFIKTCAYGRKREERERERISAASARIEREMP